MINELNLMNFKGLDIASKIDAQRDSAVMDCAKHFPDWKSSRSSYQKRRQKSNFSFTDPYELPKELQVTKFGSHLLDFGKDVDESHRLKNL